MSAVSKSLISAEFQLFSNICNETFSLSLEALPPLENHSLYVNLSWLLDSKVPMKTFAVSGGQGSVKLYQINFLTSSKKFPINEKILSIFEQCEQHNLTPVEINQDSFLMTSQPSFFPHDYCILVPEGDYQKHLDNLIVNINLKRLSCNEKGQINFKEPSESTKTKFLQNFGLRINSNSPGLKELISNFVEVLKINLQYFVKPEKYQSDLELDLNKLNLLDNETTSYLINFQKKFMQPEDEEDEIDEEGVSDEDQMVAPYVVKFLLNLVEIVKFKLEALGFSTLMACDSHHFRKAIKQFQRSNQLEITQHLNFETIEKLNEVFAKPPGQHVAATFNAVRNTFGDITGLPRKETKLNREDQLQQTLMEHDASYFIKNFLRDKETLLKKRSKRSSAGPRIAARKKSNDGTGQVSSDADDGAAARMMRGLKEGTSKTFGEFSKGVKDLVSIQNRDGNKTDIDSKNEIKNEFNNNIPTIQISAISPSAANTSLYSTQPFDSSSENLSEMTDSDSWEGDDEGNDNIGKLRKAEKADIVISSNEDLKSLTSTAPGEAEEKAEEDLKLSEDLKVMLVEINEKILKFQNDKVKPFIMEKKKNRKNFVEYKRNTNKELKTIKLKNVDNLKKLELLEKINIENFDLIEVLDDQSFKSNYQMTVLEDRINDAKENALQFSHRITLLEEKL